MIHSKNNYFICVFTLWGVLLTSGCTVKAVGDPNRPITINAHITVDIRGLKETASGIEDYVSGEKPITDSNKGTRFP